MFCLCGDSQCPKCGYAQGTLDPEPHSEDCTCAECIEAAAWAEDAERTRDDELNASQHP